MFRRLTSVASRGLTPATARRSFFYANPGEVGISASTMVAILGATLTFIVFEVIGLRLTVDNYSTKRQYVEDSTDLYNSDGTEMEGEEAFANLQIQKDRIMPFLSKE
ncbi:hypothetical protein AGDE_01346 [Angomonas deanei]|uniref:Uncharacterized protein n=1 Tax=Angomonas deanei TaxID=59799 RepID=A0A7G2C9A8_9TRYP|nr:hypothetical protein AGDE_01346 [Angomonas deanei]CAD2215631.1 hypothetical protein, conserved [Angomonas deanei]|eukprot:EPY42577.1 hypothetical protein AGDE_01346 [Angomonas deanei]